MTKNMGKTYERILLIHRKVYTYIHSNGIHRKVYTYIDTATAMNTFRDIHHPWPAEGCTSQPHRDNFTHTQSSWSLGWQEIKNRQQRELPRLRVTKLKPHTSWVFILHTVLSVHKGQLTVGSFTKSNSGHPFTDVSTQPYTSKEQEPNPHTKRCEWI